MARQDDPLDLLRGLLARIRDTRDPAPALTPSAIALAEDVLRGLDSAEAAHLLGWLVWHQAEASPAEQRPARITAALDLFTPAATLVGQVGFPEPLWPALADRAVPELTAMIDHAARTQDLELLSEAVLRYRHVLAVTPRTSPEVAPRLAFLGAALLLRFQLADHREDIDTAVAAISDGVRLGAAHPDLDMFLTNLSAAHKARYERFGDSADLDEAIAAACRAVAAANHPDKLAGAWTNLRAVLLIRCTPADLDQLAVDQPDAQYRLLDLCGELYVRFKQHGAPTDLDNAAHLARRLAATPDVPAGVLLTLAHLLDERARTAGVLDDLDAAIALVRRVAAITATRSPVTDEPGHIVLRASDIWAEPAGTSSHLQVLRLLGAYLVRRFEWTGVLADADEVVALRQHLVAVTSGQPDHGHNLASLCYALKSRYTKNTHKPDLDEAITAGRAALDLDPDDGAVLTLLADALRMRFGHAEDTADLDEAIDLSRRGVRLAERPAALAALASLLCARIRVDPYCDLDEAVDAARRAVTAAREDEFDRPKYQFTLARALQLRISQTDGDHESDRAEALDALREVIGCPTAAPRIRIEGAQLGAWLAVENRAPGAEDIPLAADLLETALRLVPQVVSHRMSQPEQRDAVRPLAGLANDAVTMALLADDRPENARAERALALVEAGRAVLLGSLLDIRGDLAELQRVRPDLAARFAAARARLDHDAEQIDATGELAAALRDIRGLTGFAGPPTAAELRAAAEPGPIVTLSVAHGGHALLLTTGGVTLLPLPDVTAPAVIDQVNAFHVALRETHNADRKLRIAAQRVVADVLKWLWDKVTGPVLDILGYYGTPADDEPWPRVWWAPGGYLSLLPLHAAGHHDTSGRAVLDRVVSSYTPTIRSLRHARRRQSGHASPTRSLVVAMPTTPNLADLPQVPAETELLTELLPGPLTLTEPDRDRVLAELPHHGIAHFACHGRYDAQNPANSGLALNDHLLSVADLHALDLDGAQLAYLSACHTAVNPAERLLDEAMHLAGALQAAGFPQVVGTLWEADDEAAVEITEAFYRGLRVPGAATLDLGRAAHALHRAIHEQRARLVKAPSLWASHAHFGP